MAEKPSESLFTLDTTGSPAIQAAYNRTHKPLKANEIIARRSAVPSLDTHKRAPGVTDGVVEPSGKRRKPNGISPREYQRLREVAYGRPRIGDVIGKDEGTPAHDPWVADPEAEAQDPRFDYLDKPKPIRAPPREASISLLAGAKDLPAVPRPRPGASYNPVFQDWDALLLSEGAKAVSAERKRLKQLQAEADLAKRVEAAQEEAEREAAHQTEDESAWEGIESDYDQAEWLGKKRRERKTPQERRKVEKRKAKERKEKAERREKEREKGERRIGGLRAEIEKGAKERAGRAEDVTVMGEDNDGVDDTMLRRRKLGKDAIPEAPLELVLPDELQDSLRLLKPEGNLLKDRFRNLLLRGKMEARKPISQPKKKRRTFTEKWSYKDYQVPV